jgi:hypothetical protein
MFTENGNTSIDFSNFSENPLNIFYFLVFYSPLFISLFIFSSGFVYQNFKGIIYLFFLIVVVAMRSFYLKNSTQSDEYKSWEAQLNPTCNTGRFTKYGHPGLNLFVIAYSFMYVCLPMMINRDINYLVFGVLLLCLGGDIGVRYLRFKCLKDIKQIGILCLQQTSDKGTFKKRINVNFCSGLEGRGGNGGG